MWQFDGQCWMKSVHERFAAGRVPSSGSVACPAKEMLSPTFHRAGGEDGESMTAVGPWLVEFPVVKVQVESEASALPARSLTPLLPPLTVAVYVELASRSLLGSSVAVWPA